MLMKTLLSILLTAAWGVALAAPPASAQTSQPDAEHPSRGPGGPQEFPTDPKAVELAERVLENLGGAEAWNNTRYITWTFFGSRFHLWDKHTGNFRVEWDDRESGERIVVISNLNTREGAAYRGGEKIADETEHDNALQSAYAAWINDAYWMFMPYKMLDPGVNLRLRGEAETLSGRAADVIELTFPQGLGLTPQNKYHVYVARESGLIEQWDFFRHASQDEPDFQCAWTNWRRFGDILLSDDRGELRGRAVKHTEIAVFDELPESVFTDPAPIDLKALGGDWGSDRQAGEESGAAEEGDGNGGEHRRW